MMFVYFMDVNLCSYCMNSLILELVGYYLKNMELIHIDNLKKYFLLIRSMCQIVCTVILLYFHLLEPFTSLVNSKTRF